MAEILIASCPPIGHVGPLLNVARGLVDRGDRVTFLTSERHAWKIYAAGAHPHPLPAGADYDDSSLDADLPGRAATSGIQRVNFDVAHLFVRPLPYQAQALADLLAQQHFDAIIADSMFLGVLPLAARRPVVAPTDPRLHHHSPVPYQPRHGSRRYRHSARERPARTAAQPRTERGRSQGPVAPRALGRRRDAADGWGPRNYLSSCSIRPFSPTA